MIGLLRGFCVGDTVTVWPGEMREYHDISWRYALPLTGVYWRIVDCDDSEPRYRIEHNTLREWVFSDEITHYYEN